MITYSIIQKSQLEGAKRLDAEYYQPEYLAVAEKLKNAPKISELTSDIRYGLYVEPEYKDDGVGFLRATNLLNFWIDGEILKIDEKKVPNDYKLKVGDSLIVRSGANTGCVGLIYPKLKNSTFGSYTIRLRFNKINPFFASIFLNTKYGILQTQKLQTGMAQPNLNIPNIKEIKIPIVAEDKQKEIEELCIKIEEEKKKSESLYSQTENLLLEELGMKNFIDGKIPLNPPLQKGDIGITPTLKKGKTKENPPLKKGDIGGFETNILSYIINLSDAKAANRFDAEYFEPKYQKITEHIKNNFKWSLLGDLATVKKGFEPGAESYREEGKQFIRVSSLSKYEISDSEQKCLSEELYNKLKADYRPQKGEILLTKDASPGIAYVLKENIEGIISSGILRLKLKNREIEDEYLALCLNSIIGKMQTERDAGGSVIIHWKPEEIKNVIIPVLPKPIQQKISLLVRQSFKSREWAKLLLEEAKRKVEEIIEGAIIKQ